MRLEEVTEEETLADGTLYKLYMMNVYALEQLAKIDLSVSTEACKDFVKALYSGMCNHSAFTQTIAMYKCMDEEKDFD